MLPYWVVLWLLNGDRPEEESRRVDDDRSAPVTRWSALLARYTPAPLFSAHVEIRRRRLIASTLGLEHWKSF
jgi:hypothetical protein